MPDPGKAKLILKSKAKKFPKASKTVKIPNNSGIKSVLKPIKQ